MNKGSKSTATNNSINISSVLSRTNLINNNKFLNLEKLLKKSTNNIEDYSCTNKINPSIYNSGNNLRNNFEDLEDKINNLQLLRKNTKNKIFDYNSKYKNETNHYNQGII